MKCFWMSSNQHRFMCALIQPREVGEGGEVGVRRAARLQEKPSAEAQALEEVYGECMLWNTNFQNILQDHF